MSRKYYSLLTRENGVWHVQFGDYDRDSVYAEMEDGYSEYIRTDKKVICTTVKQADIVAAVAKLNQKGN